MLKCNASKLTILIIAFFINIYYNSIESIIKYVYNHNYFLELYMIKRILFVDDNENFLEALKEQLQDKFQDIHSDFVTTAKEAIKRLAKLDYNALVTDFKMPGIHGLKLIDIIEKDYPDIVRIILSEYPRSAIHSKAKNQNFIYLPKNCGIDKLVGTIEKELQAKVTT